MRLQLIEMIQRNWGCRVYGLRGRRKALLADTNKGPFFVKSYLSMKKAEWVVSLSEQLARKGFAETLEYICATDGRAVVPFEGKYYVAIKPIQGRDAQYDDLRDVTRTVRCLAEFHRRAKGIVGGPVAKTEAAPLIDKWENRLQRFSKAIENIQQMRRVGNLEKKIVRLSPFVLAEAEAALDVARRSPLIEEYERAVEEQAVAHRDLASHNFLIGEKTYLIDYDTAIYDTPLVDLAQMIDRTLDQQKWSLDCFYHMMEQYRQISPLSDEQYALVYLLLRYPDNFMREVVGLYESKQPFLSKKIDAYLMMIMKLWPQRIRFFEGSHHFFDEAPQSESSIVV